MATKSRANRAKTEVRSDPIEEIGYALPIHGGVQADEAGLLEDPGSSLPVGGRGVHEALEGKETDGEGLRGVDGAVLPAYLKVPLAAVGPDGQIPAVHGNGRLVDVVDGFPAIEAVLRVDRWGGEGAEQGEGDEGEYV